METKISSKVSMGLSKYRSGSVPPYHHLPTFSNFSSTDQREGVYSMARNAPPKHSH